MPNWNTISISGYHIREAGSTAVQEVAFTFAHAIAYVQAAIDAGLDVNQFGQRLSFFFNAHNDFLEEIAKFRAARRLWARIMRDRFGATNPRAQQLRFHTQTAGQHAHRAAARQQHRSRRAAGDGRGARRHAVAALQRARRGAGAADRGVGADRAAHAADHRGRNRRREHGRSGRRLVRDRGADRRRSSASAEALLARIDQSGGTLAAIERGFIQREIQESAYRAQVAIDSGQSVVVGVNRFAEGVGSLFRFLRGQAETEKGSRPLFSIDPKSSASRSNACDISARAGTRPRSAAASTAVAQAARDGGNLVPPIIAAVEARATVGEISDALRAVFGEYEETATL